MNDRVFAVVIAVLLGLAGSALASEFTAGDITVRDPWSRATVGAATNGVVYMTIVNRGDAADRLLAASAAVAGMASLHESTVDGGVMKMRPVTAIAVGPGETVVLKPGGLHIMLMNVARPLREGEMFPADLTFERAGTIRVQVTVGKAGALNGGTMKHD